MSCLKTEESLRVALPNITAKQLFEYRKVENRAVINFFERVHPVLAGKVRSNEELSDREEKAAKLLLVPEMFESSSYSKIRCMSDSLLDAVYTYYVTGEIPKFKEVYKDWLDTVLRFNDIKTLTINDVRKISNGRCHTLKEYVYEK